ncbi:hypothetical protein POM88_044299 [Heracleum sosnowskyi]|uniref:F-box associated beta-propeller type 1 domain-containing protein n=1 Tax=Heracleum sosnowskyi TaxID=360622 RepID=A0AAD8H2J1_9APIA|nr:hypothetical protein POM88_044299 [Heracleum sosnowskyi]
MDALRKLSLVLSNWGAWGAFLGSTSFNRLYYERNPKTQYLALPVSHNNLEESSLPIFSSQKLPLQCEEMAMICSCDGWIGFIHPKRGFLWNPSSQLSKTFDLPPFISQQSFSTGLGFDSKREDFKIVILLETQVKSYSSTNNLWTYFPIVPFSLEPNSNSKFVINGVPYWVGKDSDRKSMVFSFDPTSEAYTLIPYPPVDESRRVYVFHFGENVGGLAYSHSDHTLDIFVHLKKEGWVKSIASVGPIHDNVDVGFMMVPLKYCINPTSMLKYLFV